MDRPSDRLFPLLLALPLLLLELASLTAYGYFRDELYYLASTEHLAFGYVDHPPLAIWILAAIRAGLGDSLVALRIVPALLGAATIVLVAHLARRMGGGRVAQTVAALGFSFTAAASIFHFYSMNAWDVFLWVLAFHCLLTALERSGDPAAASGSSPEPLRSWLLLGAVLGLGLLNKISVLWLGVGILAALLLTRHRRVLKSPGPWLAGVLALLLFSPYLIWQTAHGWPTIEFVQNATRLKMVRVGVLDFFANQVFTLNPVLAPFWLLGLGALLFLPGVRRFRLFAWIYLTVAAILIAGGGSRPVYLLPAYPPLLAAAGLAIERLTERPGGVVGRWAPRAAIAYLVAAAALAPIAVPLLPPEQFVAFARTLGMMPPAQERMELAELPQFYADHFGWPEMVAEVERVYRELPPEDRARVKVFGQNYGEAGAIDVLGRRRALPGAISGHNSYWLWGPGEWDGEVLIILGGDLEGNREFFEEVVRAGTVRSRWAIPYENDLPVWVGRRLKMPVEEAWERVRRFI
ncbi:MAG: glycosyltransferase family 39 protein [Thermoanaerobaculia bacterium]|nr:glycosyltransferase family 39 protein [Thermoanaerobaculia bacterium]